jgi:hypothetical protein
MDLLEDTTISLNHWYYFTKYRILKKYLRFVPSHDRLIDIGAGSAIFSRLFLQDTAFVSADAVDINYDKDKEEETVSNDKRLSFYTKMDRYDCDLILLMDLLEHIENDKSFLKDVVKKSEKGTVYFITVPAFNFLFSAHDIYLKHFRRYNKNALRSVVEEAGLEPVKIFYSFYLLFPIVALIRIVKKCFTFFNLAPKSEMKDHSKIVNFILSTIHKIEYHISNPFFGLTCVCIARKR